MHSLIIKSFLTIEEHHAVLLGLLNETYNISPINEK